MVTTVLVVGGKWLVVSGQRSAVSGQWSVVSGQWSMVSGQWSEAVSPLHGVVGVGRHPHCVGEQPVPSPAAEVGLYVSGQRRSHLCTGWSGWAGTLTV